MPLYSDYVKERTVHLFNEGKKAPSIAEVLRDEGFAVSRVGIHKLLTNYKETGTVAWRKVSGRPSKASETVDELFENQMRRNDETTAAELQKMLASDGEDISVRTVLRHRVALGWTYRGSSYCQLIRQANKTKRLEFAITNLGYSFEDAIFTDECSVQLETHRRFCCRKQGEAPHPKPRYTLINRLC